MKKILSLILALVMVLGICACASGGAAGGAAGTEATDPAAGFKAGYAKVDITPLEYGVEMGGYGNEAVRLSSGLMSYIYAIAVAVQDSEGNTAVMVSLDQCSTPTGTCSDIRQWAETNLGIPKENIIISSEHQHSTPVAGDGKYASTFVQGVKDSIKKAVEDLAPAEMYYNHLTAPGLTFVRRFWANDGDFVSSHSGSAASGIRDYESPADQEMRLIKFTREGKKDIIMVNHQGHPHMSTSSADTNIGSDWPGVMRDEVSKELGVEVVYFSGAGGNMNSGTRIEADRVTQDPKDFKSHGKYAASFVIAAEDSYTKGNVGTIRCLEETQTYSTDHSLDHLLSVASTVHQVRSSQGMAAAHEEVKKYPELNSAYQASAIVNKAALGATKTLTYTIITFGDVAMSAHPYEMFDTNGKELRDGTVGNEHYAPEDQLENPFAMHFVATLGNGSEGYMPSYDGFTNGGYERDTTRYAQGTGELIVGDILNALHELKK